MKKILTLIALLCGTALVYGQGTVVFYNASTTYSVGTNLALSAFAGGTSNAQNAAGVGMIGTASDAYYFTLLLDAASPSSANPLTGGWLQATNFSTINGATSPLIANNFVVAGSIEGPNGSGYSTVTNLGSAWSGTVNFEIVGWSANLGTTWAQVAGELASGWTTIPGYSDTSLYFFGLTEGSITLGATTGPGAALTAAVGGPLDTLDQVLPIPEPSTLALAGLGGLSLLLFRRRK